MVDVRKTEPDRMYRQEHPIESNDLIAAKMDELEVELTKIPDQSKAVYLQAVETCPNLVTYKEKLQFLRCEVFNADLAAKRMVAYWEKRLEVFGSERAFLPLTLTSGILTDQDMVALRIGFVRLLPEKVDAGDRTILFADPSRQDHTLYDTINMVRATWYMLHAALEDDDTQRKGIIMMVYPHNAKLAQFDRNRAKQVMGVIKGCVPVRLTALHVCHPPAFFQIVFPILKLLLGTRLRARIQIHYGSQEHVLERLETKFGLSRTKLPMELGGAVTLDHHKWLDDRGKARRLD